MTLFQIRYIINGFRIGNISNQNKIWIDNNAFFQRNEDILSCLIITEDERCYDNLKMISNNSLLFIKVYSLIQDQGCSITYSGTSELYSENDIGKKVSNIYSLKIQNLKYITEESVKEVKELFDKINNNLNRFNFLKIALDYWTLAKEHQFKTGKYETIQFLHAMISLESLLGGDVELRYKISIRLSLLLGLLGYDSLNVFKNTKEFYDKRSNIVHGGSTINDNSEIIPLNIKTILQYSRDCILCCLILTEKLYNENGIGQKKFKEFFLNEIDQCLLDVTKRDQLKDKLKSNELLDKLNFSI